MRGNHSYLLLAGQALLISITPVIAWAQTYKTVLENVTTIINDLVMFLVTIVGAFFMWGVFVMVSNAGNETKRKQGISIITYSLIGMVLIVSLWGIVNIAIDAFGIEEEGELNIPQI